jgi:hypothetical protein
MTDDRLAEIKANHVDYLRCVVDDVDDVGWLIEEVERLRESNRRLMSELPRCGCLAAVDAVMRQLGSQ